MSLTLVRLVVTFLVVGCGAAAAGLTALAAGGDNTWTPAGAFVEKVNSPVFALAVDPADGRRTLAGTASGTIYLSPDGGTSWTPARKIPGHAVLALAFDPARPGAVLAGTRGAGIWRSADAGLSWQSQQGSETSTVRAFAFLNGAALAASDQGVLSSRDGGPWSSAGLPQVRVSALTVLPASNTNGVLVAGGDATQGNEPLPLFSSTDGGRTWAAVAVTGPAGVVGGSSMVAALASGPAPRQGVRTLLMGTNTGLFMTRDQGASWQQLTGGGALPATDVTSVAVAPGRTGRLYVASDGGGSAQGSGLWVSSDAGGHFASLAPPVPEVTALAVTGDDPPTMVMAAFRPIDQTAVLWTYRDAGGQPHGPVALPPSPKTAAPARGASPTGAGGSGLMGLVAQPEAPYLAVSALALAAVLLAAVAYLRRGRRP